MAPTSAARQMSDMTSKGKAYFDMRDLPSSGRLMNDPEETAPCHEVFEIILIRMKNIASAANADIAIRRIIPRNVVVEISAVSIIVNINNVTIAPT